METNRFELEKYKGTSTRHPCPECGKKGEFARYIDTWNRYKFPDNVGRCNSEFSCRYHYRPSDFFKDNPDERNTANNE